MLLQLRQKCWLVSYAQVFEAVIQAVLSQLLWFPKYISNVRAHTHKMVDSHICSSQALDQTVVYPSLPHISLSPTCETQHVRDRVSVVWFHNYKDLPINICPAVSCFPPPHLSLPDRKLVTAPDSDEGSETSAFSSWELTSLNLFGRLSLGKLYAHKCKLY